MGQDIWPVEIASPVSVIRERVSAGLEYARRRGTRSGRPIGRPKAVFRRDLIRDLVAKGLSGRQIARQLGVGEGTVRRAMRELTGTAGSNAVICCGSAVVGDDRPDWNVYSQLGHRFPACARRPDLTVVAAKQ